MPDNDKSVDALPIKAWLITGSCMFQDAVRLTELTAKSALSSRGNDSARLEPLILESDAMREIDRLKQQLRYQESRDGIQTTHAEGCYAWGPSHYDCALREVERLNDTLAQQAKESGQ